MLSKPRHQLRPVPYALSLRPGAIISRSSGSASLTLRNGGTGPALSLEGSGRLESSARSYFFVPGMMGWQYDAGLPLNLIITPRRGGMVRLNNATAGFGVYEIPIALPGHLYGQNVTIEEVRIYYVCDGDMCGSGDTNTNIYATAFIRGTSAYEMEVIEDDLTNYYGTDPHSSYALDTDYTIGPSSDSGTLSLDFRLSFGDSDDYIYIQSVRITVRHE